MRSPHFPVNKPIPNVLLRTIVKTSMWASVLADQHEVYFERLKCKGGDWV
jgi:hypothetical protein